LNAGILSQAFAVFALISFFQGRMDLAAFCGVVAGALMAFLWFNFYPARFFMGDTGAFSLGATLGVVALLTNSVIVLPFVVIIYVIESSSVIVQLTSKKIFKKKVFWQLQSIIILKPRDGLKQRSQ
jgi:phospho-N-acetylmuramoyl-pentapeptide-transferase